ncbi:MAG: ATP-dependent zinc protease [Balneolaceae bacterium]|nr:ATP-dependent zinc protease [Balneolaceae bacterium]MBO6546210.1 ATP-dependent zinc protease [Balneolaceae bacterium]MBO6648569.1 ATP-dependent zinc protease [Balneolaceae bacterium]
MRKRKLHTIGRIELVELPEWDIQSIEAKIDTGAYTSSLHCHHIEEFEQDGKAFVRFNLLDPEHPAYNDQLIEFPILDRREVKSSNGVSEYRFFIQTVIKFFNEEFNIELSLTDRSEMKYPILIGRKFLKNKFVVDVSKKNLSHKT